MQDIALVQTIARTIDDKKAYNIAALNVSHLTVLCDYMVLASGRSTTQVSAIADALDEKMTELGIPAQRIEGMREARWIVMDYGNIIVHIFHQEEREYYNLERLWEDGSNRLVLPFETEAK